MTEDYASSSEKQKAAIKLVEEDKGNRIAILNTEIEELSKGLDIRIEERERIETEISNLNSEKDTLEKDVRILRKKESSLRDDVAQRRRAVEKLEGEKNNLTKAISDLESKRSEKIELASLLGSMKREETELIQSIDVKTREVKSLELRAIPLREESERLAKKEMDLRKRERLAKESLEDASKKLNETAQISKETEKRLRIIDLSGKTMGHYIRGMEKEGIFDSKGKRIDVFKLLDKLNKQ